MPRAKDFKSLMKLEQEIISPLFTLMTLIEYQLGMVIAHHYIKNDYEKILNFGNTIAPNINFEKKIRIFKEIVPQYPKILRIYRFDDLNIFKKYIRTLDKIRNQRNNIAHRVLDRDLDNYRNQKSESVQLIRGDYDSTEPFIMTRRDFDRLSGNYLQILCDLENIQRIISQ